jgi:hypothetical protein
VPYVLFQELKNLNNCILAQIYSYLRDIKTIILLIKDLFAIAKASSNELTGK